MFIRICVLFLYFCQGAFLRAISRDTRLSALLVKKKKENLGGHLPYWWEETQMGFLCLLANCKCVGAFFWHRTEPEQRAYRFYRLLQLLPPGLSNIPRKGRLKDSRWLSLESRACHFLCPEKWRSYMCLQSACYRPHLQEPEEEHSVEKPGPMLNHKQLQGCSEWICFSEW